MKDILIIDSTLRDGNHAVKQRLNEDQISSYAAAAEKAGMPIVVVGHGNGLGASSLQVGESLLSDSDMIRIARGQLKNSKLGVFSLPGFATINKDLKPAIDAGAQVVCVGCHCTEADVTERHIKYSKDRGIAVYGNLMMTHMASGEVLAQECLKMQSYGVDGVILMDSAGTYLMSDVIEKISAIKAVMSVPVGFHAHNNLGLAVANSIVAVESGAGIIDACARGFGAGAGNAPLEMIIAILERTGHRTGIDLYHMLDAADIAEEKLIKIMPRVKTTSIVSGLAGVFSGFIRHVDRISLQYGVDARDILFELGKRKAVAGQEDMIIEIAANLAKKKGGAI